MDNRHVKIIIFFWGRVYDTVPCLTNVHASQLRLKHSVLLEHLAGVENRVIDGEDSVLSGCVQ